jgi:hypothetical protein
VEDVTRPMGSFVCGVGGNRKENRKLYRKKTVGEMRNRMWVARQTRAD